MTDTTRSAFGDGPLSRAAALAYTLLVVEVLLLLTTAPGLAVLVLLDRDPANLPLVALCALPLGPALSAALYALHGPRDLTDLHPAARFLRGYRLNAAAALKIWTPVLAALALVAVNLAHLDEAGLSRWWTGPLLLVGALTLVCGTVALTVASLFTFRTRDVARLAAWSLGRTPLAALGVVCLLFVTAAVVTAFSEAVAALAGSLLAMLLLQTLRPFLTVVERDFTA